MRIAVFGDLHYADLPSEGKHIRPIRDEFYERFFQKLFSVEADLYVSIGDLTNYGTTQELEEVYNLINKYGKKFIHVLGNHDVYENSRNTVLSITGQKRYQVISTDSATLCFIDTTRNQDIHNWGGTLDKKQLDWLSNVVEQSYSLPLLIFGHHPIYQTTANSEKEKLSIDPSIPISDLLKKKSGIGIYINGHNHYNSIVEKDNWTFVQLAAVLDHQAIRIFDISESDITVNTIDLSDQAMKQQAQLIGNTIHHFSLSPHQLGTEQDLSRTIILPQKV